MKRKFLLFAMIALVSSSAFAQSNFNKWSVDLGFGANKPWRNMTYGYYTDDVNFFTGDIGVRYMWSEYVGLKMDFGYNSFGPNDNSKDFSSDYMRTDLQAVINAGRVLRFEDWTKTIGLLVHGGGGLGWTGSDFYEGTDANINIMSGATLQFRLGNRVALNLDGTAILPGLKVDKTFDGASAAPRRGVIFNGTVGLSVYLGGNEKHADWYIAASEDMSALEARFNDLEKLIEDVKNETAKASELASAKDKLNNVSNDVEKLKNTPATAAAADYDEFIKQLAKDGFISVYFDNNSSKVNMGSVSNVNFLKSYLDNNSNATVEVRGYADETGAENYNKKLSQKRADAAAKLLVEAGISESRINAVGMGVDSTVDVKSTQARQLARRASFVIK